MVHRAPYFFILANLGAFSGVMGALRGERFSVWQSASHSRGTDKSVTDAANGVLAGTVGNASTLEPEKFRS